MGIMGETEFQLGCEAENKISKNGEIEPLLEVVRERKLQWFSHHTSTRPGSLAHDVGAYV